MTALLETASGLTEHSSDADPFSGLRECVERAAHLLPAQGPITAFVHHNTLHAFEELPFLDGVVAGARVFGCLPFLPEERFRKELARERIRIEDLEAILRSELKEQADEPLLDSTRLGLRLAMLQHPIRTAPLSELRWLVAESDALQRFRPEVSPAVRLRTIQETRHWMMRDVWSSKQKQSLPPGDLAALKSQMFDVLPGLFEKFRSEPLEQWSDEVWESFSLQTLWRVCQLGVARVRPFADQAIPIVRHRDLLLDVTGVDADLLVHDILIRFCGAYLDQGFGAWTLPERDHGFVAAFKAVYSSGDRMAPAWLRAAQAELQKLDPGDDAALASIAESLRILGVSDDEQEQFLVATCLALRGWGGMIWQMETRSDRAVRGAPAGSLIGFLAVRLLLDRCVLQDLARNQLDWHGPLAGLRDELRKRKASTDVGNIDSRAFQFFQVAQFLGWLPEDLVRLNKDDWSLLVGEIEGFSNLERRRVFHLAYERRYRQQALDAITVRAERATTARTTPRIQAIFCLDEREESFRRWLEELSPSVETFGVAGFFGIAMYYRGLADAHYVPLCPIIVRPQNYVCEDVVESFEEVHRRRAKHRRALGSAGHNLHVGSRTFAGGALLTTLLGPLASIPLVARVLFPGLTGRIRSKAVSLLQPPRSTRLRLQRSEEQPGPEGGHIGYSVAELANIAERILQDMGFTSHFARLVLIFGHGSTSLNNPHKAAYDCGACAGALGGPNARALAAVLNDPQIREILRKRGIEIPDESVFVGGWHNTSNDNISFYDSDKLPASHRTEFEEAERLLDAVSNRNAHERSRRFQSASLNMTFEESRGHVRERSEDLAQTRPELGHATNALTIVGRRSRTRGLFLDRRAFLTSYDPTQDTPNADILLRILAAVVPVCAGINLEYYFSHVDPTGWGCGTKLPHNVASLLGVMDGPSSDLRTGLPWQMVEVHEPVRSLFVIETTPELMHKIMEANAEIRRFCTNEWVQLALLDPNSSRIRLYQEGRFCLYRPETTELKSVDSSVDWYRGWRDHLGFALVRNAMAPVAGNHARETSRGTP